MKYSTDNIIEEYAKYLLIYSDLDKSIAYLIMYLINVKYPNGVQVPKRLNVISWIQNIFDTINPYANNMFSSFDIDFEDLPNKLNITFYNDYMENDWIRSIIEIEETSLK